MFNKGIYYKSKKYLRPTIILLAWLVVMTVFLRKEILPSFSNSSSSIPLLQAGLPELVGDEWMGIFFQGEQIGYSHTVLFPHREEGFYGSALDSTLQLDLSFQGRTGRITVHSFFLIAPGGELAKLQISARSDTPPFTLNASMKNKQLHVKFKISEVEKELSFPFYQPSLPIYALTPFLSLHDLNTGESFSIPALDPLASINAQVPEGEVIRFEVVRKSREGYYLLAFYEGITADLYLDSAGDILEITTPFGWSLKRQSADIVMKYLEGQCRRQTR